jgi:FAD/FMN-containing dehydrogenase
MGTDETRDAARFEEFVEIALEGEIIQDAAIARSIRESQEIWAIRDASGELQRSLGPYFSFDVSLPIRSIGRFVDDCRRRLLQRWPDVKNVVRAHRGQQRPHRRRERGRSERRARTGRARLWLRRRVPRVDLRRARDRPGEA